MKQLPIFIVCLTFVGKFIDQNAGETDEEKVKENFRKMCKSTKKDDNRLVCMIFMNLIEMC